MLRRFVTECAEMIFLGAVIYLISLAVSTRRSEQPIDPCANGDLYACQLQVYGSGR